MCRTLNCKVTSGMDSAVRVMATLRRKQFEVKEFKMMETSEHNSELFVTLEDTDCASGFEMALLHMKKLMDVYDVQEVC